VSTSFSLFLLALFPSRHHSSNGAETDAVETDLQAGANHRYEVHFSAIRIFLEMILLLILVGSTLQ
jgi:hypothetical protein